MRRMISAVAFAAVVGATLTACSSGGGGASPGDTTLQVWSRGDGEAAYLEELIDQFEEESGYSVEMTYIPFAQFPQRIASAVSSGDGPDVAFVEVGNMPYFESLGAFAPLDDFVGDLDGWEEMAPSQKETSTWDGATYGVPYNIDVSLLYYNKTLFAEAGLDPEVPPASWEEFEAASNAVAALGDDTDGFYLSGACPGCNSFHTFPFIWGSGGEIWTGEEEEAVPTLDDPVITSAMGMFQRLWQNGDIADVAQTDSGTNYGGGFGQGKLGMSILGSFNVAVLKDENPDLDFGVAGLPTQDGSPSVAFVGGDVLTIPTTAQSVEGAEEFIKFMTSSNAAQTMIENNITPARIDLIEEQMVPLDERYTVFAEEIKNGRTPKFVDSNAIYGVALSPYTLITDAIFTGEDIATVQEKAQAEALAIVE